jgi:hypothetical protein
MAGLNILTTNAAGDGWIDLVPGPGTSTSYEAQNANFTARNLGLDLTSVKVVGATVVVEVSGPVDVNGVPFVVNQEVILTPTARGNWFIAITPGGTSLEKEFTLTQVDPTWIPEKNAYYTTEGHRVLNWSIIHHTVPAINRIVNPSSSGLACLNPSTGKNGLLRWSDSYVIGLSTITTRLNFGDTNTGSEKYAWGCVAACGKASVKLACYLSGGFLGASSAKIHRKLKWGDQLTTPGLAIAGTSISAICMDEDAIFAEDKFVFFESDPVGGSIYKRDFDTEATLDTISSPGGNPTGIVMINGDLWSCDGGTNKVYRHNGETSEILTEFDAPFGTPIGLAEISGNLIILFKVTAVVMVGTTATMRSFLPIGIAKDDYAYFLGQDVEMPDGNGSGKFKAIIYNSIQLQVPDVSEPDSDFSVISGYVPQS